MRKTFFFSILVVLLSLFAACAEDEKTTEKGEESAVPEPSPKADTWFAPTVHGELVFGQSMEASIEDDALFHAWDFHLSADAEITLDTIPSANLDTVIYLYHRANADASWGSYIARNDDHNGEIASHIEGTFGEGDYRLMVKGHKDSLRGAFGVMGTCTGEGCPGEVASEPLSESDAAEVIEALDNICPDTFCGGDFNYYGSEISCDFSTKACTVVFDAQSYYEEDVLPMTALDALSDDARMVTGSFEDGMGTFEGKLLEMVDKGEDGIWLRSSCMLSGNYQSIDDLLETSSSYPNLNDTFYTQFLDCLSAMEMGLFYEL